MDLRQAGIFHRPIVSLASIADNSYISKNKDAWGACFLRSEEGGQGW